MEGTDIAIIGGLAVVGALGAYLILTPSTKTPVSPSTTPVTTPPDGSQANPFVYTAGFTTAGYYTGIPNQTAVKYISTLIDYNSYVPAIEGTFSVSNKSIILNVDGTCNPTSVTVIGAGFTALTSIWIEDENGNEVYSDLSGPQGNFNWSIALGGTSGYTHAAGIGSFVAYDTHTGNSSKPVPITYTTSTTATTGALNLTLNCTSSDGTKATTGNTGFTLTTTQKVYFSGSGYTPGSTVTLYDSNNGSSTHTVGPFGNWNAPDGLIVTYMPISALQATPGTLTLWATDVSGQTSDILTLKIISPTATTATEEGTIDVNSHSVVLNYDGTYTPPTLTVTGNGFNWMSTIQIKDENDSTIDTFQAGLSGNLPTGCTFTVKDYDPKVGTGYIVAYDVGSGKYSNMVPMTYTQNTAGVTTTTSTTTSTSGTGSYVANPTLTFTGYNSGSMFVTGTGYTPNSTAHMSYSSAVYGNYSWIYDVYSDGTISTSVPFPQSSSQQLNPTITAVDSSGKSASVVATVPEVNSVVTISSGTTSTSGSTTTTTSTTTSSGSKKTSGTVTADGVTATIVTSPDLVTNPNLNYIVVYNGSAYTEGNLTWAQNNALLIAAGYS